MFLGIYAVYIIQGDPKRFIPMKISIVALIKKLFLAARLQFLPNRKII